MVFIFFKIFFLGVLLIEKRLVFVLFVFFFYLLIFLFVGFGKGCGRLGYGDRVMGGFYSVFVKIGYIFFFRFDFEVVKYFFNFFDMLGDDFGFGCRII